MPEERGLYKKMLVGEQTLYLAQLKGLSKKDAAQKINYWFDKFDINTWKNKRVDELSKGMQQKVQFISTILHQPRLLILDEPFSGLDPINSNLIKQEIFELSRQGTTIIFSTHRMEQVEEICDHIVLLNKGHKILDGSVAQIRQDFKRGLFKVGLGTMPNPAQMATYHFNIVQTHDKAFTVKMNEDSSTNDILLHFIRQNIPVTYFEEILPSINEVFITQVQQTEAGNATAAAMPLA
jgi:ABC-2 type transport system ATP-binding protein